jgi:hypothetical protein
VPELQILTLKKKMPPKSIQPTPKINQSHETTAQHTPL